MSILEPITGNSSRRHSGRAGGGGKGAALTHVLDGPCPVATALGWIVRRLAQPGFDIRAIPTTYKLRPCEN